jgi:hypothetical protein
VGVGAAHRGLQDPQGPYANLTRTLVLTLTLMLTEVYKIPKDRTPPP